MHSNSGETKRPPTDDGNAVFVYLAASLVFGILVCTFGFAGGRFGLYRWDQHYFDPPDFGDVRSPVAPDLSECATKGLYMGLVAGPLMGSFLWLVALHWRPAKHPISAALFCASFAGSVALAILAYHIPWRNPSWRTDFVPAGIILACVIMSAAVFGFLTMFATQIFVRWSRRSSSGPKTTMIPDE